MAIAMDDLTVSQFTTHALQNAQQAAQGHSFLMEAARTGYLTQLEKIGTREAVAMQETRVSAQSREILQSQAALQAPRDTVVVQPK